MSQLNVTVDDFDPVVSYSNYEDWQTPNPQDHPDWWNATQEVTGSQWHEGEWWSGGELGREGDCSPWLIVIRCAGMTRHPQPRDADWTACAHTTATYHYTTVQGAQASFNFTGEF